MHSAAEKGRVNAIRALQELGADGSIQTDYGSTPMDVAKDFNTSNVLLRT